ncbi:MAM and LDL-receptor class A domain-containing 2-like, partial [Paramuricea clavata]
QENNFVRYPKQTITTLGLQYDYESVLHYGNTFFSKNGRPTILATTMPLITLGQRNGMSKLDYAKINVLYDCKFHQPDSWSQWSPFSPCDELCRKQRQRFCYSEHPGRCDDASSSGLQTHVVQCSFEECYGPYDCDFTDNTCGWRQSSFDDFEWARTSEGTPSRNTGPDWDHTGLIEGVEESHGHFMYIEASGKPAGYHAKLESPVFQDLDGRDSISNCLSFYYNMYGLGMGQLNIYLVFIDGRHELLWKTSGNHGKAWHHGTFTFTSFSTYKIVFEAVRGDGYTSDVAIDDDPMDAMDPKDPMDPKDVMDPMDAMDPKDAMDK